MRHGFTMLKSGRCFIKSSVVAQLYDRRRDPERSIAPYAINLIIHRSNERLEADLAVCAEHQVPIIITSLSAPNRVVDALHCQRRSLTRVSRSS